MRRFDKIRCMYYPTVLGLCVGGGRMGKGPEIMLFVELSNSQMGRLSSFYIAPHSVHLSIILSVDTLRDCLSSLVQRIFLLQQNVWS